MNKKLKVILNILTVIAALIFLVMFVDMISSIRYAHREVEDPAESFAGVFEYELEHRAYGEIIGHYYTQRLDSFTPKPGYEDLYRVSEYAHTAFMTGVYEEKGDTAKASSCREKMKKMRAELGEYEYTADEIDGMVSR